MKYKDMYLARAEKEEVKNWINVNLENYLKKHEENLQEIEHIIDYLNSEYAPKNLVGLQYKSATINAQKWVNWLQKTAGNIMETDADVEIFIDFKNGVKLVKLIGKAAFEREGKLMGHCVASYYGKSSSNVYSLRDSQNRPHCTIEVTKEGETIQQIKGRGNGAIHPKYIKYILKSLKKLGNEVREHDMPNLGYLTPEKEYWNFVESNFTGIQHITLNNKKYLYKYSNMKNKE